MLPEIRDGSIIKRTGVQNGRRAGKVLTLLKGVLGGCVSLK